MPISLDTNPLRLGLTREQVAEPCVFAIIGGTGDLAQRKLMPALFSLYCQGLLPQGFAIIGMALSNYSDDEYRELMRQAVERAGGMAGPACAWENFASGIRYITADFTNPNAYKQLVEMNDWATRERGTSGNIIVYMAIPPSGFYDVVGHLEQTGLPKREGAWTRVVVEKPMGYSLEEAKDLNSELLRVFDEDQVYRIDHYLGKETVQNIQVFRFANSIFEPLWNQRYIDHVQITIAESIGVGRRGGYYEKAGALRDMIQNHGLQLLSLVAMEPSVSLASDDIRDEKLKVLRSVRHFNEDDVEKHVVRGQYGAGLMQGESVPGYREEERVDPESNTETYVALKMQIDNMRWSGVPFYIRTGKRLSHGITEIAIQFKSLPDVLFGKLVHGIEPNILAMRVQPDEGITFRVESKVPGLNFRVQPVLMDFRYGSAFGAAVPEAYERLLLDVAMGDQSLYARIDSVEEAWELVTPILKYWGSHKAQDFPNYQPGTWGPQAAFDLIERDGRRWRKL